MLGKCARLGILLMAVAAAGGREADALGMRVSPGGALIQGVVPGERVELGTPLIIMNEDGEARSVVLSAVRPSDQGVKLPPGYADIPDVSWISFSQPEVQIPGRGTASVRMILSVPAGEEHLDRHWSVTVAVRSKPAPGQMVALALYPRFEIETASSTSLSRDRPLQGPPGVLLIAPGTLTIELSRLGGKAAFASLRIWNGTDEAWRGEIQIIAGAEAAKRERLDLSGGWRWLPDPSWIKIEQARIEVPPRHAVEVALKVAVPDEKANYGAGWEAVLLAKSANASTALARVRVKTPRPAEPHPAGQ